MASKPDIRHRSMWMDLFTTEKCYPFLEKISFYLTMVDFVVLCQVCRELRNARNHILADVSRINERLKSFVASPDLFRSQLGSYNVLISGSFALNLLELGHWKVSRLDLFIRDGVNADHFTNYICEHERYQNEGLGIRMPPEHEIFRSNTRPGMEIRVIRTSGPPLQHILTSAYTTACVNFITWNKAYSIFPRQNLIDHDLYPLRSLDDEFGSKLRELAMQGWSTQDIIWPDFPGAKLDTLLGIRRVGQQSTLVVPLEISDIQAPLTPDFVIEYSQFEVSKSGLGQDSYRPPVGQQHPFGQQQNTFGQRRIVHQLYPQHNANQLLFLTIRAHEMVSPAMRHAFTIASKSWHNYADARLQRWAWVELYKLEPASRPLQSLQATPLISEVSIPEGLVMPQSWVYADNQIPKWFQQWE